MANSNKEDSQTTQGIEWIKTKLKSFPKYVILYLVPQSITLIPFIVERMSQPEESRVPVERIVIDTQLLNSILFELPFHDCPPEETSESPLFNDQGLLYNSAKYPNAMIAVKFDQTSAIGHKGSNASSFALSRHSGRIDFEGPMLDVQDLYEEIDGFSPLEQLPSVSKQTEPSSSPLGADFGKYVQKGQKVQPSHEQQFTFDPKIFQENGRLVPNYQNGSEPKDCFNVELSDSSSHWCSPETLLF